MHGFANKVGRDQSGAILIELLVGMAMMIAIVSAAFLTISTTERDAPREHARSNAVREAQAGLDRMTRELRQAYAVNASGYDFVDFNVARPQGNRRVIYDCSGTGVDLRYRRCVRSEGPTGGAVGAPVLVLDGLLNATGVATTRVFTADDPLAPRFVGVRIEVSASTGRANAYAHKIVLDDGVYLRNLDLT